MALDRKVDVLLDLAPDIAVVCECAEPERLRLRSKSSWMQGDPVWIGRNPHKGLAVFAFNGYAVRLAESYHPALRYIAPVHVGGPTECNLLGRVGAERQRRRHSQAPAGSAAAGAVALQGFSRRAAGGDRGRPQQQHDLGQAGLAHQPFDQGQDPRGELRPGQRLSRHARRGARRRRASRRSIGATAPRTARPITSTMSSCRRCGSVRCGNLASARSRPGAVRASAITCPWSSMSISR